MKKGISLILIFSLVLTSFVSYGRELDIEQMSNSEKQAFISEGIKEFEEYFKENNVDVIEQLNLDKNGLLDLIEIEEDVEEIAKLKKLADSYDLMIEDYKEYIRAGKSDITPYGVNHPTYRVAIAAIITYFSLNGYTLAAELLNHATYDSNGGQYNPYFGGKARETTAYKNLRKDILTSGRNSGSGSSSFPNSGTQADKDLYYAIHLYKYSYYGSIFTLSDVYDFELGHRYSGLAGTAIDLCYMAQTIGVIVPFVTIIKLSL